MTAILSLPVLRRESWDNSMLSTIGRCPRLGLYQYILNRAPSGKNYPIALGIAYHTFREHLENLYLEAHPNGGAPPMDTALGFRAFAESVAMADWEDPPIGHKHEWYTYDRAMKTLRKGFDVWMEEKRAGRIHVLFTEQPFELELPNGKTYGGRIDQIVEWNDALWVRDFKTTSRMGASFADRFDPNNQLTGYVWAARLLSGGRKVEGCITEVPYNTKTKGPEIHQFLSTRTPGQVEQWLAGAQSEIASADRMLDATPSDGILAWPMRTSACDDYGGCFYRNACRQDNPAAIERWLHNNTDERIWDFTNPDGVEAEAA